MDHVALKPHQILELVPQQRPFRFLDHVSEIDQDHAVGHYTFRNSESFYPGHFPKMPITPGVILLEAMGQLGLVALGLYLLSLEMSLEEMKRYNTVFTDAKVEFYKTVLPGQKITMHAQKIFWRKLKLRSKVVTYSDDGECVSDCVVSGCGVTL